MGWQHEQFASGTGEPVPSGAHATSRGAPGGGRRSTSVPHAAAAETGVERQHPQEDAFLDFQHFVVRKVLGGNHQAPVQSPRRILDAGCGSGRWAAELAVEFPGAQVVGLDITPPTNLRPLFTALGASAANISFVAGDLLRPLPFPDGAFDFVHMRCMFADLPASRWPELLCELVRVTRPGGWIECIEPAEAVHDAGPVYLRTVQWIAAMTRGAGLDPDVGPKLKALLRRAGIPTVAERAVPSCANMSQPRERRMWQTQCIGVLDTYYRDPLVEAGIVTNAELDHAIAALRHEFQLNRHANADILYDVWGQRPRAAFSDSTPSRPNRSSR